MNKTNHKLIESLAVERKQWAAGIGKLCRDGYSINSMCKVTGKSRSFVRRVMDENGFKLASEIDPIPEPAAQPVTDKRHTEVVNISHSSSDSYTRISLPREPFEIEPTDRRETAPRGRSYMVSRPVTEAEHYERAVTQVTHKAIEIRKRGGE